MDHQEHLPLLYRALDSDYLPEDFFLNANARGFDPRRYFSLFVGAFLPFVSLARLYWWLTFLGNWAVAGATARAARIVFSGNALAPPFAAALVMSVPTVAWGSVSVLSIEYLTPNALAFALALWALVWLWEERFWLSGAALGCAALLHPLVGPECGALLFGTRIVLGLVWGVQSRIALLGGMGLWLGLSAVQLLPYFAASGAEPGLSDAEFIRLYAYFRNPHHILPSYFLADVQDRNAGWYLLGLGLTVLYLQYKNNPDKGLFLHVLSLLLGLAVLAVAGWFFVEIRPLRLVATAQTFRLLYLAKWLILVLVGGVLAHWAHLPGRRNRLYALGGLATSFVWVKLWGLVVLRFVFDRILALRLSYSLRIVLELGLGLALLFAALCALYPLAFEQADLYVWLAFVLLLCLPGLLRLPIRAGFWPAALLAGIQLGYWESQIRRPYMHPVQAAFARQCDLDELPKTTLDIARQLQALTPPRAQLIVPPGRSEWRFLAQRALVVEFKTYPFGGQALLEWQQRLFDVYGYTEKQGFDAVQWAFVPFYEYMHDAKLDALSQKYGADYAVLYSKTPTEKPVLYQNTEYKIVQIAPERAF